MDKKRSPMRICETYAVMLRFAFFAEEMLVRLFDQKALVNWCESQQTTSIAKIFLYVSFLCQTNERTKDSLFTQRCCLIFALFFFAKTKFRYCISECDESVWGRRKINVNSKLSESKREGKKQVEFSFRIIGIIRSRTIQTKAPLKRYEFRFGEWHQPSLCTFSFQEITGNM